MNWLSFSLFDSAIPHLLVHTKGNEISVCCEKGPCQLQCDRIFFVWEFGFPQLFSSHALFVFSVIYLLVLVWQSVTKLKLLNWLVLLKIKQRTVLTLYIQCSNIGSLISQDVVRHTSVFSGVCPLHIRYCQLLSVCRKTDPGIDSCIYRRSISDPWYCWYWISSNVARENHDISLRLRGILRMCSDRGLILKININQPLKKFYRRENYSLLVLGHQLSELCSSRIVTKYLK